jgi:hypothetical protein
MHQIQEKSTGAWCSYRGEAADAQASRRRRDLDDLERVLVLLLLPLQLSVRPVLLPAHHRQTRLRIEENKDQQVASSSQLTGAGTPCCS